MPPASVSGVRRRLALPAALRRRPELPGGRPTAIAAACIAGLLVLFAAVLVYTPLAHPRTMIVDGVTGPSEHRIVSLLEEAGGKQSTFAVDEDDLMRAVAAYPEVAGVQVNASPPFKLEVRAIMRPPVARLQIGGRDIVVAGDGTILQRAAEADVPKLDVNLGRGVDVTGGRVHGAATALTILGAAPQPLLAIARAVRTTHAGVEVEMARGPRLIFGNAEGATDKWAAASAVIADGSADGATYIDLRVPSRPAVGGIGGTQSAVSTAPPQLTAGGATPTPLPLNTPGAVDPPAASAGTAAAAGTGASAGTASGTQRTASGTQADTGARATGTTTGGGAGTSGTGTAATPNAATGTSGSEAPVVGAGTGGGGATIGATP